MKPIKPTGLGFFEKPGLRATPVNLSYGTGKKATVRVGPWFWEVLESRPEALPSVPACTAPQTWEMKARRHTPPVSLHSACSAPWTAPNHPPPLTTALPIHSMCDFLCSTASTATVHVSHHNSVHLSVTRVNQSKTVQAMITKSSPLAAWKTLVSGIAKLFLNSKGFTWTRVLNERGRFSANKSLYLNNGAI